MNSDDKTLKTSLVGGDATVKEGDIFRNVLDGVEYVAKTIVNNMVVLESTNGDRQILTGIDTLKIKSLYRKLRTRCKTGEQWRDTAN